MASPKRAYHEVEGYVHEVSPVVQAKSGNARYFTALLQEADKNSRVVVFDVQKHNCLQCAERDRTPMKLSGVGFSPSKQIKNTNDILVNSKSKASIVRRLAFAFEDKLIPSSTVRALSDIIKDLREFQRVTVNIKMIHALEDKETVVRGQKVRRKSVVVADASDLLLLTLWGQHDLVQGSWHRLENVSVRQFKGMATLSTTVQTTISQIEDCGAAKKFTDTDLQTVVGEIVDAEVKVEHFCPKHHLLQTVNSSTLMTRCKECQAFCKTTKTKVEFRGHVSIMVKSALQKIHLDDVQIRDLLKLEAGESVDSHSLVADILVHDEMCIQTWREFVAKISFTDKSASSSSGPSVAVEDTAHKTTPVEDTTQKTTEDSAIELEGEDAADLDALFDGL